jgi:hypothetical protein
MRLRVHRSPATDVYKDMVRIPETYRVDFHQKPIKEGRVCKLSVDGVSHLVVVRGVAGIKSHQFKCFDPCIHMDEVTRNYLKLEFENAYDFKIKRVQYWRATVGLERH